MRLVIGDPADPDKIITVSGEVSDTDSIVERYAGEDSVYTIEE